jgi:PAS domain S-box-containing protein
MKDTTFATRLKALFEQKRLTLAEVARAIGTSPPSVHRWTRGGEIDDENLRALARFLDVNWIWLRYGDEAIQSLQDTMTGEGALADERRHYLGEIMASEARLNLAQEMARIVTWEWNVLTDELTLGAGGEQILGRPTEPVKARLLPFRALDLEALRQKFGPGQPAPEWDVGLPATEGGGERWFTSRGRMLLDAHDRPSKLVGVSIEITQRKQMETALERSETLLRKVVEMIPVGLFIADETGRITTANPEAERIWGGARRVDLRGYGEYKGRWARSGEALQAKDWTLARAVQTGEVSRGEIVHIDAFDGESRTIIMSAIPLLDGQQGIIGAIEVNQDITALDRTEQSLRAIADQWRAVFEQPTLAIAYEKHGEEGLVANRRFAELLGATPDTLSARSLADLMDAATRRAYDRQLRAARSGETAAFELGGRLSQGGTTAEVRLRILRYPADDAGSAFRVLAFVTEAAA